MNNEDKQLASLRERFVLEKANKDNGIWIDEDRTDIVNELIQDIITYLASSPSSFIIKTNNIHKNLGPGALATDKGITFRLTSDGQCCVIRIDNKQTSVRIPRAVLVEDKYYLVTQFDLDDECLNLIYLRLPEWLFVLSLDKMPNLQTVKFENELVFSTIEGAVYRLENNIPVVLKFFPSNYEHDSFKLPDSVYNISIFSFRNCKKIPDFTGARLYWKHYCAIIKRSEFPRIIQTEDGNNYIEIEPKVRCRERFKHFVLKDIPRDRDILTLHRYLNPEFHVQYILEGIALDKVNASIKEIHLYGFKEIPEDFIQDRSFLPNLREITLHKECHAKIGNVFSSMLGYWGWGVLDTINKKLSPIPDKYVEETLSYLLSTDTPRIEKADRTAYGAYFAGLKFRLYASGICSVFDIDKDVTHVSIPQAILVDGKYYLVIALWLEQTVVRPSLKTLHLSNTIILLKHLNLTSFSSLESISSDKNGEYWVDNGALYTSSKHSSGCDMVWFPPNYHGEEFQLPADLNRFEFEALWRCKNIPIFRGESKYWSSHDTIEIPSGYMTKDGNVFEVVANLYWKWPNIFQDDKHGGYYSFALLKKIGRPQKSLSLDFYIDRSESIVLHGIDLDSVCESVTEIHLYGVSSGPENFIRNSDMLPNVDNIFTHEDEFMHDIPDLAFHKGLVLRPTTRDRDEVAIDSVSRDFHFRNLSIPGVISDGEDTYKVTSIGKASFKHQCVLEDVTIPDTVRIIEEEAFAKCEGLMSVVIPSSVVEIGQRAFFGCTRLTGIYIPESVIRIGDEAFWGCRLIRLSIPASLVSLCGNMLAGMHYLAEINVKEDNPAFRSVDGVLYNASKTMLIKYPACKNGRVFEIPSSVVEIRPYAFQGCKNLESVVIPESVRVIGDYAFSSCKRLSPPPLPPSVIAIGKDIFSPD